MSHEITYRKLGPPDVATLLAVPEGLFDNPVDPVQARDFLSDPRHVILLAFDGDLAVGMATGTVLLHPDKPPAMFVNEVGVRDAYQRRGIGAAITARLLDEARGLGCVGIWLATEPENAPAIGLYRALSGEEAEGVLFGWDEAF